METFYKKDGAIHNTNYLEMYFPSEYFIDDYYAINLGNKVNIFGLFPIREIIDGKEQPIRMFTLPTFVDVRTYSTEPFSIECNGKTMDVIKSVYPKDSYLFPSSIPKTIEIAEKFLSMVMDAKLPPIVNYLDIIDEWWYSLEITGENLNVPSTMYEALIMTVCRNAKNLKERYGMQYARDESLNGTEYRQLNTRTLVSQLSTFSGLVFEDINKMTLSGIINTINGNEEAVSPLESIMYY